MLPGNKKKAGQAPSMSILEELPGADLNGSCTLNLSHAPLMPQWRTLPSKLFFGSALGKMASTLVPSCRYTIQ